MGEKKRQRAKELQAEKRTQFIYEAAQNDIEDYNHRQLVKAGIIKEYPKIKLKESNNA